MLPDLVFLVYFSLDPLSRYQGSNMVGVAARTLSFVECIGESV